MSDGRRGMDRCAGVRAGFLAMLPLWAGAIPVGIAYAVAAGEAGLTPVETQVMSLVVYSAAAQLSAVALLAADAPAPLLIGTAFALNLQLALLGLASGRRLRPRWPARLAVAWLLTDGAYAIAAARGPLRLPVLLGTGASMYLAWNLGTGLGIAAGQTLPRPDRLGLDVVAPLTFLAVLLPLVRTRAALLVALVAAATALSVATVAPAGVAILIAGLVGIAAGAVRRDRTIPEPAT